MSETYKTKLRGNPYAPGMKARITVITLGVDDLDEAVRFYRDGLGLQTPGIMGQQFEHGAVAFFNLKSGLMLAVWPRDSIAHDAHGRNILGWLRRLFSGSGWSPLGSFVESRPTP